MLIEKFLAPIRESLLSRYFPWYRLYITAKQLHESSQHGLFRDGYYHLLTETQKKAARECPRLNQAIEIYKQCIEIETKAGRILNAGITHRQLGLIYQRQGRLEEAYDEYNIALNLLEDLPNAEALPALSSCHLRLGEIAINRGDKSTARYHLERSKEIDLSLNYRVGIVMSETLLRDL